MELSWMDKEQINDLISQKLKLIRTEKEYTQDKMAEVLGISKKTLVQIEKGRIKAGWTTSTAVCALFRDSDIIRASLGDDPLEILEIIAHQKIYSPKSKTMGGKIWWRDIDTLTPYRLQQNLISQHYRILDEKNKRWYSTFDEEEAKQYLSILSKEGNTI